jgi:hypothetical protein
VTTHSEVTAVKAPGSKNDFSHRMIKNLSRVFGFLKMWLYSLESIKCKSKPAPAVECLSFKNLQCSSVINKKFCCHQINKWQIVNSEVEYSDSTTSPLTQSTTFPLTQSTTFPLTQRIWLEYFAYYFVDSQYKGFYLNKLDVSQRIVS